jgi:hypothetical protein
MGGVGKFEIREDGQYEWSMRRTGGRPDRMNKRTIVGHVDEAVFRRFKMLMAKHLWTTDTGVRYALYLLFEHLERKQSAESGAQQDST